MKHNVIFDELAEWLAQLAPQKVLEFRTSDRSQERLSSLLEKNKTKDGLTEEEEKEVEQFMLLNHIVSMAKSKALLQLSQRATAWSFQNKYEPI